MAFDTPAPHETASFAACDTLYERDSSLAELAGTYISDGSTTLTIDDQGEIFYQQSSCAGSGTAELIDPDFNMYRMEITIEALHGKHGACARKAFFRPGLPQRFRRRFYKRRD